MSTYNIISLDFRKPRPYGFISDTMYIFEIAVDTSNFIDDEKRNPHSKVAMLTSGKVWVAGSAINTLTRDLKFCKVAIMMLWGILKMLDLGGDW